MPNYPAQIDTTQSLPTVVDNFTPIQGAIFNRLRDAVLAIEIELGIKPSGNYGTVAARIAVLEGSLNNLQIISLSGDLGHTLSKPQVIGIYGRPISSAAPNVGDIYVWNGVSWALANTISGVGPPGPAGPNSIADIPVQVGPSPTLDGYVVTYVQSDNQWEPRPSAISFVAGGDLSGTAFNQTVIKLRGTPLSGTPPTDGQVLTYSNADSQWEPKPAPTGFAAGGDLSGTATSQTLSKIQGHTVSASSPSDGNVLTYVATDGSWEPKPPSGSGFTAGGDLSGSASNQTVNKIQGNTVSISSPSASDVLAFNGSSFINRQDVFVNVLDHGVKGDGSTDDTVALQALLDSLTNSPDGSPVTVYFPSRAPGEFYKITKPLVISKSNNYFVGENVGGSIIRSDGIHMPAVIMSDTAFWPTVVSSITGSGNSMVYGANFNQYFDLRDVSYMVDLDGHSALSIECTFQNDDVGNFSDQFKAIYAHSGSTLGLDNFAVSLELGLAPGSDSAHANLVGYLLTGSGQAQIIIPNVVVTGVPLHVALCYDGTNLRLFYGHPGSTTTHQSAALTGNYTMSWFEGCWVGRGLSDDWPHGAPSFRPMIGKVDSLRISNFNRYTTDFTTPVGKLDTSDAQNLNVGGAGNNTYYVTNFETYLACWKGYTWASGIGQAISYITNRTDGAASLGGEIKVKIESMTIQTDLGRALQCIRAIGCFFRDLELYGTYGLTLESDDFYSQVDNVNVNSTGPFVNTARSRPYCIAGYLAGASDVTMRNFGVFGSFGFGIYNPGTDSEFLKIASNGYAIIPIFLNQSTSFGSTKLLQVQVDDENVGLYPGYPTNKGNWMCCVYLSGINMAKFESCSLTVESSNDVPVIIGDSFVSGSSAGYLAFDSCLFIPSQWGTSQPIFKFIGNLSSYPTSSTRITNSLKEGINLWTSLPQGNLVSVVGTTDIDIITQFGAVGDGTTDNTTAFLNASSATSHSNKIYVPAGTYKLTGAHTITGNLKFAPGAMLYAPSGTTLTLTGTIDADLYHQIFQVDSGGAILPTNVPEISVGWYGAINDPTGTVFSAAAIQLAIDSCTTSSSTGFGNLNIPVKVPSGFYHLEKPISIYKNGVNLIGDSNFGSYIGGRTYVGPAIVMTTDGYFTTHANAYAGGNSVTLGDGPGIRLCRYGSAWDLNGLSQFCLEFIIALTNPETSSSNILGCNGSTPIENNVAFAIFVLGTAFGFDPNNPHLSFQLTTTAGSVTAETSGPALPTDGTYHVLRFDYDGSNMRIFVDGVAQALIGGGTAKPQTGTIVQKQYEAIHLGYGLQEGFDGWNPIFNPPTGCRLASMRFSWMSRGSADYSPPAGKFTEDGITRFLMNFDINQAHGGLTFARSYGGANFGLQDAWLPNTFGQDQMGFVAIKNLQIEVQNGVGIDCAATPNITFEDLTILAQGGISLGNNAYNASATRCQIHASGNGRATEGGHGTGVYLGAASNYFILRDCQVEGFTCLVYATAMFTLEGYNYLILPGYVAMYMEQVYKASINGNCFISDEGSSTDAPYGVFITQSGTISFQNTLFGLQTFTDQVQLYIDNNTSKSSLSNSNTTKVDIIGSIFNWIPGAPPPVKLKNLNVGSAIKFDQCDWDFTKTFLTVDTSTSAAKIEFYPLEEQNLTINLVDGYNNISLTFDQWLHGKLTFTGTTTTTSVITIPAVPNYTRWIINHTTYRMQFTTGSGISAYINPGVTGQISCVDGINVYSDVPNAANPEYINVVNFGAKGDGVTDDTAAIQAAVNSAFAIGTPTTVYFPNTGLASPHPITGATTIYRTTKPIFNPYSGVKLLGAGLSAKGVVVGQGESDGDSFPVLSIGQTVYDTIFTVRGNFTTALINPSPASGDFFTTGIINLGQTPGNDIHGLGVSSILTADFTQPTIPSTVTVQVASTVGFPVAYPSTAKIYIQGGGIYNLMSIVDSTHLTLQPVGFPETAPGGTVIHAGTLVQASGLTVELMYDPLVSNNAQIIMCSSGSRGNEAITQAFVLSNNIYSSGDLINARLQTTNGLFTVTSTHPVTPGALNHVGMSYDGYHLYVMVDGYVDSVSASGTIVQNNWEQIYTGIDASGNGISLGIAAFGFGQGFQYDSLRITQAGLYDAPYTPPTSELTYINRLTAILVNFSAPNRPVIAGAPGANSPVYVNAANNLAAGYVIAQSTTINFNLNPYNVWLRYQPIGDNYKNSQGVSGLTIESNFNAGITTSAMLTSVIEKCQFLGFRGIDMCQFSYTSRIADCGFNNASTGNCWSWCVGLDSGTQYAEVKNCSFSSGTNWAIMSQNGGNFMNLYIVPGGRGALYFPAGGANDTVTLTECFITDDQARVTDCMMFLGPMNQFTMNGGYIVSTANGTIPLFRVAGVLSANIEGILDLNGSLQSSGIFQFQQPSLNNTRNGMIRLSGQRFFPDNQYIVQPGTLNAVHGSSVLTATSPVTAVSGQPLEIISQPGSLYRVATDITASTSVPLMTPYAGPTNSAATFKFRDYEPWIPEDGYGLGQGFVYITPQEKQGNTINWVSDTDLLLMVNDFMWGTLYFTDWSNVLTADGYQVILPLILGYERKIFNQTNHMIKIGGSTGPTINIPSGSGVNVLCDKIPITGTVQIFSLSTVVVGTGTHFTTDLQVGQEISFSSSALTFSDKYYVQSIASDTSLTLAQGFGGSSASGITLYASGWIEAPGSSSNNTTITSVSTTYTANASDNIILADTTSIAFTIFLPLSPAHTQHITIKDFNGNASINNIVVDGNGNNIDGNSIFTMNSNYGNLDLLWNGTSWSII